jgi:Beta propeller domain
MDTTEKFLSRRFRLRRHALAVKLPAGTLLALAALTLSACATSPTAGRGTHAPTAADVALVRFNSCSDALRNFRAAAASAASANSSGQSRAAVGSTQATAQPPQSGAAQSGAGASAGGSQAGLSAPAAAGAAQGSPGSGGSGQVGVGAPGSYSGTNTATPGVDEPDLVKTDGRRIVTVSGGVIFIVDAQTRQLTGALNLSAQYGGWTPASLLLAGNHALVLFSPGAYGIGGPPVSPPGPVISAGSASPGTVMPIEGPRLVLVDLSTGTPVIMSQYTMDGSLVDARQIGSIARVVIKSAPRLYPMPYGYGQSGQSGALGPNAAVTRAGISQWLPRYSVTTGAVTQTGLVDCASVSHPAAASYTGSSMLTVLTFDLSASSLGNGEPVTIVADGDTVYSDGTSLYIASREWAVQPAMGTTGLSETDAQSADVMPTASPGYTGIYKFDISGTGRPVYEASGSVPGWLLGSSGTAQYSLSVWNGALRAATTTYGTFTTGYEAGSVSAVYVLEQSGDQLVIVGKAGGLGAGEQIYAVRFVGPAGYVETFRQTDPLYTLDLSDPAQPRVVGQLPLSGYSAYLYPVDATHLIGIGQSVNAYGETAGTQISLFDVSDLAAPVRLATYDLQFGHSEAEFDPHAFLYWPATRLLVLPVQLPVAPQPAQPGCTVAPGCTWQPSPYSNGSEAVVLHVGDHGFTELGTITHPATINNPAGGQLLRSLIVGSALWTLSDSGLKANDSTTLAPLAWVPFSPVSQ